MVHDVNTRAWTRFSIAGLMVAALVGALIGGVLTGAQEQPIDAAAAAQPDPRRTAYVDFLTLLKEDKPLAREQLKVANDLQAEMDLIDTEWEARILAQKKIKEGSKPHTKAYRDAMRAQLEAEKQRYEEKLLTEQTFAEDLRKFGINRFLELRNLARDIALERGYNEVLNIVREVEKLGGGQDDFKALQQQLLVSPVLYFEKEHDITDIVSADALKRWGETISFADYDKAKESGGIGFYLEKAEKGPDGKTQYEEIPVKRNEAGEIEIKLEQKGIFKIEVLDKGVKAEGARAATRWTKRGLGVGTLDDQGTYEAPNAIPVGGPTFVLTVRSAIDPTIEQEVTIRLK